MSLEEVNQTGNKSARVLVLVEEFWKTTHPLGRRLLRAIGLQLFALSLPGKAGSGRF